MKPAPVSYLRPGSLTDAVAALAGDPGAKVLAGGQSLVPLLSMRLAAPTLLVDVNRLPGLDHVHSDAAGVRVGALARHAAVLADPEVAATQPLVAQALAHVAHATIRNRGTTVGSLVHADAAAEMPMVLTLLGGSVEVEGPAGRRTIAAGDLYAGPLESTLRHDEVAVEALFPALAAGEGTAFSEIARRHGDYALVGVGAVVEVDPADPDRVVAARAGYLSVSDVPVAVDLGEVVAGRLDDEALAEAAEHALTRLDPAADIHATAAYRTHLVRVLTARVLRAAHDDARRRAGERAA